MRSRTRITPTVIPAGNANYKRHNHLPPPPSFANPIVENVNYPTAVYTFGSSIDSSETMVDELPFGKYQGTVKHEKKEYRMFAISSTDPIRVQTITGVPPAPHSVEITGGFLPYTYLRTRASILSPVSGTMSFNWQQASFYALKEMRPKFSDLSLANDLIELQQIKDLAKPFGRAKSRIGKAANATLWLEFGVKPTVDSILGTMDLIRSLPDKIRDLKNRANRLQTRHYRGYSALESLALPSDPASFATIENAGDFREVGIKAIYRWVKKPIYSATLKFRYDVSSLTDLEYQVRAWSQALGIDKPLSVAWNAIPFSFVVDWFVNVGDWIDSLQPESVLPIVIEDFSHSVKYSYKAEALLSYWKGLLVCPIGSQQTSYYERRRDIPSTVAQWELNMPRLGSFILGAALIAQAVDARKSKPFTRRPPTPRWLNFSRVKANQIR